jgi:hypothetical protein
MEKKGKSVIADCRVRECPDSIFGSDKFSVARRDHTTNEDFASTKMHAVYAYAT